MAHFSDGPSTTPLSLPVVSDGAEFSSVGDMRVHLQHLLDRKEKQLQQAGTFGQRVLAQQMELEELVNQINDLNVDRGDDDELSPDIKARYHDLAKTLHSWDDENVELTSAFGGKVSVLQCYLCALLSLCVSL